MMGPYDTSWGDNRLAMLTELRAGFAIMQPKALVKVYPVIDGHEPYAMDFDGEPLDRRSLPILDGRYWRFRGADGAWRRRRDAIREVRRGRVFTGPSVALTFGERAEGKR